MCENKENPEKNLEIVNLEMEPGETFLCHNWTVHCSGVNRGAEGKPRRAFSVNFVDSRARVMDPKPPLAGAIGEPGQGFFEVFASPFEGERRG